MGVVGWIRNLGKKTMYYPGCFSGILDKEYENYTEIFKKLGVNISGIPKEGKDFCCGHVLIDAGYRKEAKELALKNYKLLKDNGIKKIVTSSSFCYYNLTKIYPKLISGWDIEVEHATVTILNSLLKKRIKWRGDEPEELVYHDPCYLGRYSGIYDEPRKVIEILGGKVIEMRRKRDESLCCGAGGGVIFNFTEFSKKMAFKRLGDRPSEYKKVISPCGLCHKNFSFVTEDLVEFSSFVLSKLRGLVR